MANADTGLLTEHFGYPPVSLLDDIINSVNILAERALNSVEQALLRQPPASLGFKPAKTAKGGADPAEAAAAAAAATTAEDALRLEVENGTHQLETLLCASIDRNFDKFELYVMRNILCVRPEDRDWIRLAHYEGLDFRAVAATGEPGEGPQGASGEAGADQAGAGPKKSASGEAGEDQTGAGQKKSASGEAGADQTNEDPKAPPSDADIAHLHRRLQASLKLGNLLAAETAQNEALLAQLRAVAGQTTTTATTTTTAVTDVKAEDRTGGLSTSAAAAASSSHALAFLLDRGPLTESDKNEPLTTTTAFALSQLPALRQLSGALRAMAPDLGAAAAAAAAAAAEDEPQGSSASSSSSFVERGRGSGDKSWRRERLEYIESATKKHLERNGGRGGRTTTAGENYYYGNLSNTGSNNNNNNNNNTAVEPEALSNILGILRENHGASSSSGAAAAAAEKAPEQQADADAMDES